MCFTHDDCDWYADEVDDWTALAEKTTTCDECHLPILSGEMVRHIYMQEHAHGEYCQPDEGEHVDGCDGEGCEHDGPGNTTDHDICPRCQLLLRAIKDAEEAEGCKGHETQPALGELHQTMVDDRIYGDGHYADHARDLYPELAFSGHLDRMTTDELDDVLHRLAFDGNRHWSKGWNIPGGVYANAWDPDDDSRTHYEHGGEG